MNGIDQSEILLSLFFNFKMGQTNRKSLSSNRTSDDFDFRKESLKILFGTTIKESSPNSSVPKFLSVGFDFIEHKCN